jgi:type 1 glutamine amidotransferase/nicotinamidase-related amidase
MNRQRRFVLAGVGLLALVGWAANHSDAEDAVKPAEHSSLNLLLRSRVPGPKDSGAYRIVEKKATWDPTRSAVIVCDMWDLHHCLNATRRCGELAPRMDEVLKNARDRGMLVIHAPSDCMDSYKGHPARERAVKTPKSAALPKEIGTWCYKIRSEEQGTYPIDQTDGGEDDDLAEHQIWAARLKALGRNPKAPWKSETATLSIDPTKDYISDDGEEIWSILENRGIDNVILMGVHLNMCVLGRPFGLRQLAKNGKNVVLMRDMTDTMYNPIRPPYVSHFSGTDLITEHVEKFVAPSITSDQLLGGVPFGFQGDTRPHVVFLIADDEYQTERTLPEFAAKHLQKDYRITFLFNSEDDHDSIPGIEALDQADVLFVSARRKALPKAQFERLRRFVAAGKPVIGIRTASHAFSPRQNETPSSDRETWPTFDGDVLGGSYSGHHGPSAPVTVAVALDQKENPILKGVDVTALQGHGSLYKVLPLASSVTPLLSGSIPDQPSQPIAWTNLSLAGGRVFYTSLGHPDDFAEESFQRLLLNAIDWAAHQEAASSVQSVPR